MSSWPSARASRVLAALLRIGWSIKRQTGSHRVLNREGWTDYVFAFHDAEEIGPRMLVRIAKHTVVGAGLLSAVHEDPEFAVPFSAVMLAIQVTAVVHIQQRR